MIGNIQSIIEACKQLKIPFKQIDTNFLEVNLHKSYYFVNASTPVNLSSIAEIALDKDFTYKLLKSIVKMPKTISFINPQSEKSNQKFFNQSYSEIVKKICNNLNFPIIVKPNKGARGVNVFKCENSVEIEKAISKIFDQNSKDYDYILLAQEFVDIKQEFRVITYKNFIEILYQKRIYREIMNEKLIGRINNFIQPIKNKLDINFAGYDIALDQNNNLYLIEINTKPGLTTYIKKYGLSKSVELYKKMLIDLQSGGEYLKTKEY